MVRAATGPLLRRWPWAVGAAVLGAAAGGAIAGLLRHVGGVDAPNAQEPGELEAVVDRPRTAAPETPAFEAPAPETPAPETSAPGAADPLSNEPHER